jgi:hypothetical protein
MDLSVTGSYSYILAAKKEGTFEIPGAHFNIDGKTFRTNSVKIIVKKGTGGGNNPSSGTNPDPSTQPDLSNEIFIRTIVNKQSALIGEQVTVEYRLYFNPALQPENPNYVKLPTFEGFWAEEIDMANQVMLNPEVYNGRNYYSGTLKFAALFPTKTGSLAISPLILTLPVQASSQGNVPDNFFKDPFINRGNKVNYKITSTPAKVEVLPLPVTTDSINFSGGVGSFDIKTTVKKRVFKKNEPIRFEVTITGSGNIELVDPGKIEFDKSFEVLDPNITKNISRKGVIEGSKTIEYLLIPRDGGKYILPSIEFNYFDLSAKTLKTIKTVEIPITVSAEAYNVSATGMDTEEIDIYSNDIELGKDFPSFPDGMGWLILTFFTLPLFGAAYFVIYKKKEEERLNDPLLKIKLAAQKIAHERLAKANLLKKTDKFDQFYTETATALEGYLETKYKLSRSEFTSDKVYDTLINAEIDESLSSDVKKLLDDCELMRFAPIDGKRERMDEFYDRTASMIEQFERGDK